MLLRGDVRWVIGVCYNQRSIPRIGGAWLKIQSSGTCKKEASYRDWFKTGSGFALLGLLMNRLPVLTTQSTDTRKK